jgi:hypothetical protein
MTEPEEVDVNEILFRLTRQELFEVTEVCVQHGGPWELAALSFTRLLTPWRRPPSSRARRG